MKTLGHWSSKFANAFSGVYHGMWGQSSFVIHILVALAVCMVAWWLHCEAWQWCVLLLAIALVISLELVNSAIENLARGLCHEHNEQVGKALDISSAAVLVASLLAAILGVIVLGAQLLAQLDL